MTPLIDRLNVALAGRYRVEREIGQGGMATVYLARDLKHDRDVALKLLSLDLDPILGAERFEREIRFAARLNHPHILPVLDSGSVSLDPRSPLDSRPGSQLSALDSRPGSQLSALDSRPGSQLSALDSRPGSHLSALDSRLLFYTMPYIDGESLRARLEREPQLPVAEALRITRDAAEAIQHAHEQGIIHRDMKPENILISRDGNVLVTDFGIARAVDSQGVGLTRTGVSVGTPVYMSPEQAAGDEKVDGRTDVYSLGVVLYEMLAGEAPYTGATAQAVMMKRMTLPPPSVRVVRPRVSLALDGTIQDALASSAADRIPTPAALMEKLDFASRQLTDPALASSRPLIGRRRLMGLLVAVLGLVLLGFPGVRRAVTSSLRRSVNPSTRPSAPPPAQSRLVRIAVLPFENQGDTADAYFADGLTDAVRGKLTLLPSLQVIARASSMQYEKTDKSPRQVAGELGVRYLLTGTVRFARNADGTRSVQVRPELVEIGADGAGASRWQQPFNAPVTDVFGLQADIANRVSEALSVELPEGSAQAISSAPTSSGEAYDAYLRARAAWNSGSSTAPAAVRRARLFYQRAVALDSSFASAWGGVALTSVYLFANSVPTPALRQEAREALDRMQALDPDGVETHVIRSRYLGLVELDHEGALAELEVALRRTPNDALLLGAMSAAERSLGRWDQALEHAQAAYTLDPRTASRASALMQVYLWTRRPGDARGPADRALALAPSVPNYVQRRAMVAVAEGDLAAARQVLASATDVQPAELAALMTNIWDMGWVLDDAGQRLVLALGPEAFDDDKSAWAIGRSQIYAWRGESTRSRIWADSAAYHLTLQLRDAPDDAQRHLIRGLAHARAGHPALARADAERGLELARPHPDATFQPFYEHTAARTFLMAGDRSRALDLLEGIMRRPFFITPAWLRLDPDFASLHGDPRFEALLVPRR